MNEHFRSLILLLGTFLVATSVIGIVTLTRLAGPLLVSWPQRGVTWLLIAIGLSLAVLLFVFVHDLREKKP